ncbi:discoidin domain-containing protein [Streptacidiphilus sp. N1-12]|uniref:Discoidin domain-containing protein n=2 Tax=Streptacidiphilus alkalitolerans TaxID=3342712 RepID=A0ABV6V5C5_9ACTN
MTEFSSRTRREATPGPTALRRGAAEPGRPRRLRTSAALLAAGAVVAALAAPAVTASAATETTLSRTGWTASASTNSAAGDAPANAIDGNTNSRFSSDAVAATGMWFQVDLGSSKSFNQVVMDSTNWAGDTAPGYKVEVSNDGTNFTVVDTEAAATGTETATFADQTDRYIRIVLTGNSTGAWWSIGEFNLATDGGTGTGGGGGGTGGGTETTLSRTGWTASASTNSGAGDAPANAIDGNAGTRYSSDAAAAPGMWFQVDLGSSKSFNQVVMDSTNWAGDTAPGYKVEVSNDGTNFTVVDTEAGHATSETATFADQTDRYVRILLTTASTGAWWSIGEFNLATDGGTGTGGGGTGTPPPPTGGSLGANVIVFSPTQAQADIQNQLNTIANQQVDNEFGTQRYALFFKPGTYGSTANPLVFTVGYYTEVAGLGKNPGDVTINGSINAFNRCQGGGFSNCNATDNFWRSVNNLTVNVSGNTGCYSGDDFWAASQASPMRRVHMNGNVTLMDYCTGAPDYASGGFISDSQFTGGGITNGSQQQYLTRNTALDGWSNGVWNQVFSGDTGAPAQSFAANSGASGGPNPYTTLATSPVTQEEPYLYTDAAGNYNVFVPAKQTNSTGPTWLNGSTPGTSLPLSTFYVVNASSTVDQINAALNAGDNLLFTPGVYNVPSTIQVTHPDTKIIGLGFPTLIPTNGNTTMSVADVDGVNVSAIIFDAGPVKSPSLLQIGTQGSTVSHANDPVTVDDVFLRVGGATVGSVTTAFIDNSNNSIIDDMWSWRADHGAGGGVWTSDQADTGVIVNGNNVTAYGLVSEHYQKDEAIWNGQGGTVIFFQNENPYEVPSQAAWMASGTQKGYPAFHVANNVTSFQGYGMGAYSYFNQGVDIHSSMAFQAPNNPGVQFHDILTVFLNGNGGIDSVINGTGAAVSPTFGGPSNVVSYP